MSNLIDKYYQGFEGEPEIMFSLRSANGNDIELRMWGGYFDKIMKQVSPKEGKWTSLAYYYHLDIGWYEESPWLIEEPKKVYEQLKEINKDGLQIEEKEIIEVILEMLEVAIKNGGQVFISYE